MAAPKNKSQQCCANFLSCVLSLAILGLFCYITLLAGRLSRTVNKLESRIEIFENDILEMKTSFSKRDGRGKDLAKTGVCKNLDTRLRGCEAVSRRSRFATRELQKQLNSLKANLHSSRNIYKEFDSFIVNKREKRSVRLEKKETKIPWKLYVPVALTVLENKTLGTILALRGPPGEKGQSGYNGLPGTRGPRGKAGPRGLKGDRGDLGLRGVAGPMGRTGEKGQKGDKGDKGTKGARGGSVAAPTITVPPANQTVLSPGHATFTCEATGSPKPEVSLVSKGKIKDNRYESFGEGTLSIKNVVFADRGEIECIAKSALGEDRRTARLIVNVKAKATIKNKAIQTEAGFNVTIDCDVEGFPEPVVSWKRTGKSVPSKTIFSNNNNRMLLPGVTSDDRGEYVCQAVNAHETSSATISVTVVERLAFLIKPSKRMHVRTFLNFKIPCPFIGGLAPIEVIWRKDGKHVQGKAVVSQDKRMLEVKRVTMDDMGTYSCHVRSQLSHIASSVNVSFANPYPSCDSLKRNGATQSGIYPINPSGDTSIEHVNVYCEMEGRFGVTVISHDSEARIKVDGIEASGGYRRKIKYSASDIQIKALTRISQKCEQYISYECTASSLDLHRRNPTGWWVSFTDRKMVNWGGVSYPNKGCACSLTGTCRRGTCNCDINVGTSRDGGFLRDKDFLPVKELRFGDTGDSGEFGYHTLGKLRCS